MKNLLKFTDLNLNENLDDELDDLLAGFEELGIIKPGPKDLYFKGRWVENDSVELEVENSLDPDDSPEFWITSAKWLTGEDLSPAELEEFDEKYAQEIFDDRYG